MCCLAAWRTHCTLPSTTAGFVLCNAVSVHCRALLLPLGVRSWHDKTRGSTECVDVLFAAVGVPGCKSLGHAMQRRTTGSLFACVTLRRALRHAAARMPPSEGVIDR